MNTINYILQSLYVLHALHDMGTSFNTKLKLSSGNPGFTEVSTFYISLSSEAESEIRCSTHKGIDLSI